MTNNEIIECLNYQNEKFFGGQSEALKAAVKSVQKDQMILDAITQGKVVTLYHGNKKIVIMEKGE